MEEDRNSLILYIFLLLNNKKYRIFCVQEAVWMHVV